MRRICFFGDGLVAGQGDETGLGWVGRLCAIERSAGRTFSGYALGIEGNTSRDIQARWRSEAERRAGVPRAGVFTTGGLVFSFGVHDMAEVQGRGIRVPLPEVLANAEEMLSEAREAWPVLWIGPLPSLPGATGPYPAETFSGARTVALSTAFRDLARDLAIPYLDLCSLLPSDPAWRQASAGRSDLFPDGAGHQAIAAVVRRWAPWRTWMEAPQRVIPAGTPQPAGSAGSRLQDQL
ncbi:GDSL-type esterase/lipase family protein [Novispirillum itersonii]|uniref:GDSL-type esterase/lipase family protein n=1 Tax=Novispirillum itersonii TaxID=189 RepID=UPI00037A4AA8|nr:GDSL-type esterase/lipase family protein [Novispirillum itersonii]